MERTTLPGVAARAPLAQSALRLRQLRQRLESVGLGRLIATRWCEAAAYGVSIAAAWIFAGFALRRHARYESTAYDFGFFDQIVWNTAHGRWFETTFVDYNFAGQHFEPVLLLFAGLYRLGAGPEALLVVQSGLVAAAAVPLFYAARRMSGSAVAGLSLSAAFLLHPSLHRALDFDFHPELLGFVFVFSALYFLASGRPLASLFAVAPVMLLKEDMAVVTAMFAALLWVRGHRREALALFVVSAAWALATVFVVMPYIRGGGSDLNERFHYLTEDTTLLTAGPIAAWRGGAQLLSETASSLGQLLGGTGGIALLHPAVVLALPSIALNGLADHGPQSRIDLQYAAAPLALVFVSSALALGGLRRRRPLPRLDITIGGETAPPIAASFAVAVAAVMFLTTSPYSPFTDRPAPSHEHRAAIAEALRLVPAGANVSAQNTLVPHLSRRTEIFEFPDVREDTEFVIVDATLPITGESREAGYDRWLPELPAWGFVEVFSRDGVRVFSREVQE